MSSDDWDIFFSCLNVCMVNLDECITSQVCCYPVFNLIRKHVFIYNTAIFPYTSLRWFIITVTLIIFIRWHEPWYDDEFKADALHPITWPVAAEMCVGVWYVLYITQQLNLAAMPHHGEWSALVQVMAWHRCQAITQTNADLLSTGSSRTNFSENLIRIQIFSLKKMHLKMLSAKWRTCCLGPAPHNLAIGRGNVGVCFSMYSVSVSNSILSGCFRDASWYLESLHDENIPYMWVCFVFCG